jgi:hypothetical protein
MTTVPMYAKTLREISLKYILTPDEDRIWKIPILLNDLRRIQGHEQTPCVDIETCEWEIKGMLDYLIAYEMQVSDWANDWDWSFTYPNHVGTDSDDSEDDEVNEEQYSCEVRRLEEELHQLTLMV